MGCSTRLSPASPEPGPLGISRSEIKEEAKPRDIRGGGAQRPGHARTLRNAAQGSWVAASAVEPLR